MNQKDIEKYAFLYFCEKKDRDILNGKQKMTFEDFQRFHYLTDLIGFSKYQAEIWNAFSSQFEEQFEGLEHLYEENMRNPERKPECTGVIPAGNFSKDIERQVLWKKEFLENISDRQLKKQLKNLFDIT